MHRKILFLGVCVPHLPHRRRFFSVRFASSRPSPRSNIAHTRSLQTLRADTLLTVPLLSLLLLSGTDETHQ